jgi:hypothetical protein
MIRDFIFTAAFIVGAAFLIATATSVRAQEKEIVIEFSGGTVRNFHGDLPAHTRRYRTNSDAQMVVDRITFYVPIMHEVLAFVTDDTNDVPNAEARLDTQRRRVIGFNRAFMSGLKAAAGGNEWALVSIAAHELGHHAGSHIFLPSDCKLDPMLELEADFFSGFALGKMGVKLDDALSALRILPDGTGCTHPARPQRISVLREGWQKATAPPPTSPSAGISRTPASKGTVAAPLKKEAAKSVAKVRAAAQISVGSRFRLRKNRDVYGHDITRTPGVSLDQCAKECEANAKCKGFGFDRWNGWCFLKDSMPGSVLDPASIIGVKANVEFPLVSKVLPNMYRLRGKRFEDKPDESGKTATYEECERNCMDSTSCVAFTYVKANNICQSFRETLGHFIDARFDSGFKRQPHN